MRTPFIAGNWKMNNTAAEAAAFVTEIKEGLEKIKGVDVAVCPATIAIPAVAEILKGSSIGVGAQNMYYEESGAYTGECSPNMLTPFCQYVILGHSERRGFFGETDDGVNKKAHAAFKHGLIPIVCVGETLEQNESGATIPFVSGQVRAALAGLSAAQVEQIVFAYEPIWAIGTGKNASADDAEQTISAAVRQPIVDLYGAEVADKVRIQYGGSVKAENIAEYLAKPNIDGALVGGAALKPSFVALVANAVPG